MTPIALSNRETLKVLVQKEDKTQTASDIQEYLESIVEKDPKYTMNKLRGLKDIRPEDLIMVCNNQNIELIQNISDRKKIEYLTN
jgi:hypothetical protein